MCHHVFKIVNTSALIIAKLKTPACTMTANTVYDLAKLALIIFMLPILSDSQAQSSTFGNKIVLVLQIPGVLTC